MSRSYKHTPMIKDKSNAKDGKKLANRRVRHGQKCQNAAGGEEVALKGGITKKMNESWDICDYQFGPDHYEYELKRAEESGDKRRIHEVKQAYLRK